MEELEALQLDNARRGGWYWHENALELGVTKQAVHQKRRADSVLLEGLKAAEAAAT